jgi:outer membrane protein assembly factor BamB
MDRRLATGVQNPANPFDRGQIPGTERVLCLRESDGQVLWQHEYACAYTVSYPAGPRATPLVAGDMVFTLGAEGHFFCLKVADGKPVWSHDFVKEFGAKTPTWGFAGHPLLHGNKLICLVGAENAVAMAFDKASGKELWRALDAKEPGYCPPTLIEVAGKPQLIVWHPEAINALDPDTGRLLWSEPWKIRHGLTISQPRQDGDKLFLTAFYDGPLMLELASDRPAARVLWRGKKSSEKDTWGLHSIMPTPFLEQGHIYGVCSYGQLRCLKADTGERLWDTFAATTGDKEVRWGNAFLVKNGSRFFLFNERGELILAKLSPKGYEEVGRARLLEPTNTAAGRSVVWSHPAFASRCVFVRNDQELVCASLAAGVD